MLLHMIGFNQEANDCEIVLWSFLVKLVLNININNHNKSQLPIFISI